MSISNATLLILTGDEALAKVLGEKLEEWGHRVNLLDMKPGVNIPKQKIDVILIDIRRQTDAALMRLRSIIEDMPYVEIILINSEINITGSMAGMRAGACDELITPFDIHILKKKIEDAKHLSQERRRMKQKRTFIDLFYNNTIRVNNDTLEGGNERY